MNSQQNSRIEWIDISKGICILTIVAIHISSLFWDTEIGKYLSRLGNMYEITVFFCIAGLTLKEEKLSEPFQFIKKKIKSLYSKIIIVGLIAVFLHNVFIKIGFYKNGFEYYGKIMFTYSIRDLLKQTILTLCLANREVIIGPMWYADALFIALMILAIMQFILMHICKDKNQIIFFRLVISLLLLLISSVLSCLIDITIPRFNNTLVAAFFIDITQLLFRHIDIKFNNKKIFVISLIIMLNLPLYGTVIMNSNAIKDPAFLLLSAMTSMYVIFYTSKILGGGIAGKVLAIFGKYSFWIMAMQFTGFKLTVLLLNAIGLKMDKGTLLPIANTFLEFIVVYLGGVLVPVIAAKLIESTENIIKIRLNNINRLE